MTRSKQLALVMVSFAAAFAVLLPSGQTFAQDQAAIDKLVQMNKKALEDYDTLEWDAAKKILLDALMHGKRAGLENHPVMARTYVHLGAVYITGFKNREKAVQSFVRALEIDPVIQLTKAISTNDVNDAFAEAQRKTKGSAGGGGPAGGAEEATPRRRRGPIMEEDAGGGAAPAPPPRRRRPPSDDESEEPDLPVRINALDCPEPDEAILDKPVTLRCALSPKLSVASVILHYRAPGAEEYEEVEMKKSPKGWYTAKIPKKSVTGKSIQFFFEGRSEAGKPVVYNGDTVSPNIMLIVEAEQAGRAGAGGGGNEEEENPLDVGEGPKKRAFYLGRRNTAEEGLDVRYGKRKFWIGLGAGTGFGYAKGEGLEAANKAAALPGENGQWGRDLQAIFVPGGAFAGLGQLVPEFGYQLNPDMAVSIAGRLQYIPQGQYAKYTARGAISVLGKFLYYTRQSQVRFFGAALAGGGEGFRFTVYPDTRARPDFKDTVRGGPIVAGVGAGVYYEASKAVSIVLEVDGLAGFPIFSMVVDGTLSLQVNLY